MEAVSSMKLDKKDMVHIGVEAVAFLGMAYYFSGQNKKLLSYIEDLAQKLEEKDEAITKLEENQKQLSLQLNQLSQYCSTGINSVLEKIKGTAPAPPLPIPKKPVLEELKVGKPVKTNGKKAASTKPAKPVNVSFETKPEPKVKPAPPPSDSESDEDSDLDDEISQELDEVERGNKNQA